MSPLLCAIGCQMFLSHYDKPIDEEVQKILMEMRERIEKAEGGEERDRNLVLYSIFRDPKEISGVHSMLWNQQDEHFERLIKLTISDDVSLPSIPRADRRRWRRRG